MSTFNASGYRAKRDARRASLNQEVTLPSGDIFTLRKPDLSVYLMSGRLPGKLLEKMQIMKVKTPDEAAEFFASLPANEQFSLLEFTGVLVKAACVVPKIVANPTTEEEIAFEDLDDPDMLFICQWAMEQGGVGGENVGKFR